MSPKCGESIRTRIIQFSSRCIKFPFSVGRLRGNRTVTRANIADGNNVHGVFQHD